MSWWILPALALALGVALCVLAAYIPGERVIHHARPHIQSKDCWCNPTVVSYRGDK